MATCMYCGGQIQDGIKFCTECGAALPVEAPFEQAAANAGGQSQPGEFRPDAALPFQSPASGQQPCQQSAPTPPFQQSQYGQQPHQQPQFAAPAQQAVKDSGSIGWGVLGFFFPIVGLILFLVWRTSKPNCAKVAGIGAIIGFCLSLAVNLGGMI